MGQGLPDQQIPLGVAQVARLKRGARRKGMFRQEPEAQPVDGRDIGPLDRHGLLHQPIRKKARPNAFTQFTGRRFSEGHGKDTLRAHNLAFDPVGQLSLDAMRFARTRTGRHDDQTEIGRVLAHGCSSSTWRMNAVTSAVPSVSA